MEKRITSLLLANNPGNELVRRVKELDDKIKWLQHNSRNMDNYLVRLRHVESIAGSPDHRRL